MVSCKTLAPSPSLSIERVVSIWLFVVDLAREVLAEGTSVCCHGICLTVIESGTDTKGNSFFCVQASPETMARTCIAAWRSGQAIHLEPSLRVGDALAGHVTFGHIDAVAPITHVLAEGTSLRMRATVPNELAPFMVTRGSIAIDGVSLTLTAVDRGTECHIEWVVIPYTRTHTLFDKRVCGDRVHIEVDMLARYVYSKMEGFDVDDR